jgi:hypothetical protein
MSKFAKIIQETVQHLNEAEGAPPSATPADPAGGGGASALPGDPAAMGAMGGGAPEAGAPSEPKEMDNGAKRETDPIAFTQETLTNLVDLSEGISPELFNDWIDTFGAGADKIKDKEGFKKFYGSFYTKLQNVLEIKDTMKSMFAQLHNTLKDVISNQPEQPDNAGGGIGRAGPAGPGVK